MRLQDSQANCGPVSLRNALSALGLRRSTEELETLCRTNATEGTTARNLTRAATTIEGLSPRRIEETRRDVALLVLRHALACGRPVVLLVDNWSHYVAAVGTLGERYLVADSADAELVVSLAVDELAGRWGHATAKRPYWGLVL